MSPETALTELRDGLEIALWVGGPLLLVVLVVGVVVGVIQAATQLNEPTIAFVAKAIALTAALIATGAVGGLAITPATATAAQPVAFDRHDHDRHRHHPAGRGPTKLATRRAPCLR